MTESVVKRGKGRPKGAQNKIRPGIKNSAEFRERLLGSLNAKQIEKLPAELKARLASTLVPRESAPPGEGTNIRVFIAGAWPGACPGCGMKIQPTDLLAPYKNFPVNTLNPTEVDTVEYIRSRDEGKGGRVPVPCFPSTCKPPADSRARFPHPPRRLGIPEPAPPPVAVDPQEAERRRINLEITAKERDLLALNRDRMAAGQDPLGTLPPEGDGFPVPKWMTNI